MWTRVICGSITLLSLIAAILFNCCGNELVCNIFLGVFGSSLLTWISAIIAYRTVREEAILEYIKALRFYRKKYRRLISSKSESEWFQRREDLDDFFEEWHRVYSKIQHICRPLSERREVPKTLNASFQAISDVQGNLNCYGVEYEEYSKQINAAIQTVEELAIKMKYLRPKKQTEKSVTS